MKPAMYLVTFPLYGGIFQKHTTFVPNQVPNCDRCELNNIDGKSVREEKLIRKASSTADRFGEFFSIRSGVLTRETERIGSGYETC